MNKKIVLLIFFISLLAATFTFTQVQAQSSPEIDSTQIMMPPYDGGMPSQPFGQTHAYTVTVRGNAEAVVSMKAIFSNYEEATMSAMTLQIPRGRVHNLSAYQVIREPQCIRYETVDRNILLEESEKYGYETSQPFSECVEYVPPDYYNYYGGSTSYIKADTQYDGDTITILLPNGVSPQESGSIIMNYRASGYVKKDAFGAFNYTFETLKTDNTISTVSVGVNSDSNLILEGVDEQVYYDSTFSSAPMAMEGSRDQQRRITSPEFDSYYQQIGYGRITKSALDLQPFDSFIVEGRYAKSKLQLYGKRITVGTLLGIGFIIFFIAVIHRLVQSLSKKSTASTDSKNLKQTSSHSFLIVSGASFVASIFTSIYTIGIYLLFMIIDRSYSQFNTVIVLFVILISCVVYILIIFGPAVYIGWKRGIWWGVGTIGMILLFLSLYVGVFIVYMIVMNQNSVYPTPMYMRGAPDQMVTPMYLK